MLAAGKPLDFNNHKYLKAIYADDAREIVIMKAAQRGASEYLISWMLYHADVHTANALYVVPTDSDVSDFSAARLGLAIEASPYLQSIIVAGNERGADRVTLKRVRDRFIYFRGGKVGADGQAHQLKSIDADVLVLDEFDEMDRRVEALARKRLEHSQIAAIRIASTPTFDGMGIHASYMESDQRQWMLKCSACNAWQDIALANLVVEWDELERPTRWHGGESPFLACHSCGKMLDASAEGEWIARYPDRAVHGYHVTGLATTNKSLAEIVKAMQQVDESRRQQTWNQTLGLTYQSKQSSRLNRNVLDACRREYALGNAGGDAYAGVDVGRVLHVVIRNKDRKALFIGTMQSFDELNSLLKRFNVIICVVDALPETRKVREFQQSSKTKTWAAYYNESKDESFASWNNDERAVSIDRTRSLDDMYSRFRLSAENKSGGNTLPLNAKDIPDYYNQMCAPIRKLVDTKDGNQHAVYFEGMGDDHYAHAENYCNAAMSSVRLGDYFSVVNY